MKAVYQGQGQFKEVNPLGEEPERRIPFKHAGYYTERDNAALEKFRKEKKAWQKAEQSLRTFTLIDSFTREDMEKAVTFGYQVCKRENGISLNEESDFINTLHPPLEVGKVYDVEIVDEKLGTVKIIK